ncbi:unnamed protein product [Protopolystoma xenopodis]|uniref:Uncharacterized protein n=1 Tax=Protopolystoma xenopodis TaxID=117903 RepID=A0A3S5AE18_9PLAT|nr:unnamed protein product [Protopolystoma xenopodis]
MSQGAAGLWTEPITAGWSNLSTNVPIRIMVVVIKYDYFPWSRPDNRVVGICGSGGSERGASVNTKVTGFVRASILAKSRKMEHRVKMPNQTAIVKLRHSC